MSGALLTDLYELNMAASYLRRHMTGTATFSLFVRQLPAERGFLVAAGVEDCLDLLEAFSFDERDLAYLATLGFDAASIESFSRTRFTGEVRAIPEGRIVFADEPLLEVTAPIPEAQLVETILLNQITFQTTLASKAARCCLAGRGRLELVEFGFRRTQGIEAGLAAARVSAMVGFSATSNVEAARRYGLRPAGTMAHSYIEAFATELEAFQAFAEDFPGRTTFLVDTYDTLEGVAHAIDVIEALGLHTGVGVRLDSGDLASLATATRRVLDDAGHPEVSIFVSGGLDEHSIAALVEQGAPVDAVGVGTRLGVSADAPYLDSAYKLVSYEGRPVVKLSPGKETYPGAKQVFRADGLVDHLGLADEAAPSGNDPVLELVMTDGRRVRPKADPVAALAAARARFEVDLAALPAPARRLQDPQPPSPTLTARLRRLTDDVRVGLGPRTRRAER
jgi:nicotinate phosphoribosyltransferase